jgi:hypothetical protein
MKSLLAATVAAVALILVGFSGARAPEPTINSGPAINSPAQPAEAAPSLSMLEKEPALVPHLFSNECFMAAAYKRYQIPASALEDAYATAGKLDAYFVDMVYVATEDRCPGTEAARTAQNMPSLQAIQ